MGPVRGATVWNVGPMEPGGACYSFFSMPNFNPMGPTDENDLRVHVSANVTLRYAIK